MLEIINLNDINKSENQMVEKAEKCTLAFWEYSTRDKADSTLNCTRLYEVSRYETVFYPEILNQLLTQLFLSFKTK